MDGVLTRILRKVAGSKPRSRKVETLLVELLQPAEGEVFDTYCRGTFNFTMKRDAAGTILYEILPEVSAGEMVLLRSAVGEISESLEIDSIVPLTFTRLIEVLSQSAAGPLAVIGETDRVRALSRLAAFEAVGIPTIYALSLDRSVTEFFLDAPGATIYLDHANFGRCETPVTLTEREREALKTHMDTFKGYTIDFSNPSLKNEFDVFGNRLRVSLDLAPLAVSTFSLDVRKLTSSALTLKDLISMDVLSSEAGAFLLASLEAGMNVTIVGETGTGKTTLLNALDEAMDPRLRRIYIEDAVETKDLLWRGYHQMKLKVDPFERESELSRTKSDEIIKILHRSPDLVILGEIQSEEHSRAFFHALSAGVRGLQTFHASSTEQAIRRWREIHGVSKTNILDLEILVQMVRPLKLGSKRQVQSVAILVEEEGEPRVRVFFARGREGRLFRITPWERLQVRRPPATASAIVERVTEIQGVLDGEPLSKVRSQ